jgi:hypothetical protein
MDVSLTREKCRQLVAMEHFPTGHVLTIVSQSVACCQKTEYNKFRSSVLPDKTGKLQKREKTHLNTEVLETDICFGITRFLDFVRRPSSGILKTREHNVSETGSVSVLR